MIGALFKISIATIQGVNRQNLGLIAAGVAFYGLLALFPAIAASIALAGLIVDPMTVAEEYKDLMAVLPDDAALIVTDQATAIAQSADQGLGWAALIALIIAFYSAARGVAALVQGLNVACDVQETRSYAHQALIIIGLTILAILGALVSGSVSLVIPAILTFVGFAPDTISFVNWISWPVLFFISLVGLAILYRFGPSHAAHSGFWLSIGTVLALVMWVAGSVGFAFYVTNFGSYNETFGALGGVVILMLWLWVSAFVVLIGARVDTEIRRYRSGTL